MTKNQILAILRINGFDEQASDEEVRAVLAQAKYSPAEIENALLVLHQKASGAPVEVGGLYTVFYSDKRLRPAEISNLLKVDVSFEYQPELQLASEDRKNSFFQTLFILILSILVAVATVVIYMYIYDFGLFYSR